ncbi:MAG: haloacid dehalogenase type II [Chloroflexota bacterium]
MTKIKALVFDVGGTVFDWRTGITNVLQEWGSQKGVEADWPKIGEHWRDAALTKMINENKHLPKGTNLDDVHRMTVDDSLKHFGITDFTAAECELLVEGWHKLPAWPDALEAWSILHEHYILSPLTILSISLVVNCSRYNGLLWDAILSCEFIGAYKPQQGVYDAAPRLLRLKPEEIMMVAAHNFDLVAARKSGLRTAYVRRPDEWGADGDLFDKTNEPDPVHDIIVDSFTDLAAQLT